MSLFGPRWPLKKGNRDTYELFTEEKSQINYNLKCLLLTSPGENISDPDYGVGLRFFLFELNTEELRGEITSRIEEQASFYIPQISIIEVIVGEDNEETDENSLYIKIIYELDEIQSEFLLDFGATRGTGYT